MTLALSLSLAWRSVRRNLLPSLLTTLGITIGVGAVIMVVTLGQGAQRAITLQISSLGRNLLFLYPENPSRGGGAKPVAPFHEGDIQALAREFPSVVFAPQAARPGLVVYANENRPTTITGVDHSFFEARDWRLSHGRPFSPAELRSGRMVCVLGATPSRRLFPHQNPIGAKVRLGTIAFEVIGVLEAKGSSFGNDQDDLVLIPLRGFQRRISGTRDISLVLVSAGQGQQTAKIQRNVAAFMRERRRILDGLPDDFRVQDMKEVTKTLGQVTRLLTAFLAAIAAISLVVGGIGVMNIMWVSVKERTREIGIRIAVGAQEREVLRQFLMEAVLLAVLGGSIGMAGGLGCSFIACRLLTLPFLFDPLTGLLAFGFSAAVGVTSGYLPARHAARLDPIQALRNE